MRDDYGRNIYGQSVLLARRMIEAGTRMVTISWAPDANATWDTHGSNFKKLKNTLLPQFDAACGSLVADLAERGMLERTLVAVLGDFGRSPKVNASDGGRDHWNYCYSLMLIGGGFKGGFVYGASDKIGAFPARDALVPGDVISTIYHVLGIPPDYELHDAQSTGRTGWCRPATWCRPCSLNPGVRAADLPAFRRKWFAAGTSRAILELA